MLHRRFVDEGHFIAYNLDEFGVVGLDLFMQMRVGKTKRERRVAFRKLEKLFHLAHYAGRSWPIWDVALGCDSNGTICLYFITVPLEKDNPAYEENR